MSLITKTPGRILLMILAAFALGGCGGGGGSDAINVQNPGLSVGGGTDNGEDPDVVNGFDLNQAELVLEGPSIVGANSTSNYTARLLNFNGIPPASPPGVNIELSVTTGATNPPDGDNTDNNGEVDFQFLAPAVPGQSVLRAQVLNDDDEVVLSEGITITVLDDLFSFVTPPEDTQIQLNDSRAIQFSWRINNSGATTGNPNQGTPSAIQFTLAGRPAGGGFRLGGSSAIQDPVVVNIVNGQLDQALSVVAGDTGGPVNILATASTDDQSLQAVLPVVFVGQPTRIEATPSNIGVPLQGAELLEVQVFDQNDTPLANVPLRFRISICIDNQRDTVFCNGTGEQITRELRTTNSAGETTTGFIAGNTAGGGEIEISVNGGPAAGLERAIVYNVGGTGSNSGTGTDGGSTGGTTQVFNFPSSGAQVALGSTQDVVFNVRDSEGIAVAGEVVTFTITRGFIDDNPNTAPAPSTTRSFSTDASGDIRFQVFSNEAGTATISGGSAQLDIEFIPSLQDISVQAANGTITPGSTNTITATALDSNGDPLEGISLQFIIDANTTGGSRSPQSGISDAQGQVTTTFTAGSGTGTVVIRAANQTQSISGSTSFQVAP